MTAGGVDGPVFREPWEAQAFALVVALRDRKLFSAEEWEDELGAQIKRAQRAGDPDTGGTYYQHWLAALERLIEAKGFATQQALARCRHAWRHAAERTPHGTPIELAACDYDEHDHDDKSALAAGEHTMRYCRLRQICLVAQDLPRIIDDMQAIFGVTLAYQDPHVRKYGLANALFPFGLAFIEVVSPVEPQTAAGRFLDRSDGIGGYMAIFNCDDPLRRAAHANALGVRTAHEMRYETFRGVQLHPRDCRATMIEFDRSDGEEDLRGAYYPAGGTAWTAAIRSEVTAGIREIVIETSDPCGLAKHWSDILDMPAEADGHDFRITPEMIGIRFAKGADARECLRTIVLDVADPAGMAARAIERGYRADASGIEIAGVCFHAA